MKKLIAAFIAQYGKHFNLNAGQDLSEEQMIEFMKQLSPVGEDNVIILKSEKANFDAVAVKALAVAKEADATVETVDLAKFVAENEFVPTTKLVEYKKAETDVVELTTAATTNAPFITAGKNYLGLKRTEAIALYEKTVGAAHVDASVVELFKSADDAAINGLLKQYTKGVTEKFCGKCADCQSTNFTFQSALLPKETETQQLDVTPVTTESIHRELSKTKMFIGRNAEQANAN